MGLGYGAGCYSCCCSLGRTRDDNGDAELECLRRRAYATVSVLRETEKVYASSESFVRDFSRLVGRLTVVDERGGEHSFRSIGGGEAVWTRMLDALLLLSFQDERLRSVVAATHREGKEVQHGAEYMALRELLQGFISCGDDAEPRALRILRCINQSIIVPSVSTIMRAAFPGGGLGIDVDGHEGWIVRVVMPRQGSSQNEVAISHEKQVRSPLNESNAGFFSLRWKLNLSLSHKTNALSAAQLSICQIIPGRRMPRKRLTQLLKSCDLNDV